MAKYYMPSYRHFSGRGRGSAGGYRSLFPSLVQKEMKYGAELEKQQATFEAGLEQQAGARKQQREVLQQRGILTPQTQQALFEAQIKGVEEGSLEFTTPKAEKDYQTLVDSWNEINTWRGWLFGSWMDPEGKADPEQTRTQEELRQKMANLLRSSTRPPGHEERQRQEEATVKRARELGGQIDPRTGLATPFGKTPEELEQEKEERTREQYAEDMANAERRAGALKKTDEPVTEADIETQYDWIQKDRQKRLGTGQGKQLSWLDRLQVLPRMSTPEEALGLPSGTKFIDSEGTARTRP